MTKESKGEKTQRSLNNLFSELSNRESMTSRGQDGLNSQRTFGQSFVQPVDPQNNLTQYISKLQRIKRHYVDQISSVEGIIEDVRDKIGDYETRKRPVQERKKQLLEKQLLAQDMKTLYYRREPEINQLKQKLRDKQNEVGNYARMSPQPEVNKEIHTEDFYMRCAYEFADDDDHQLLALKDKINILKSILNR